MSSGSTGRRRVNGVAITGCFSTQVVPWFFDYGAQALGFGRFVRVGELKAMFSDKGAAEL